MRQSETLLPMVWYPLGLNPPARNSFRIRRIVSQTSDVTASGALPYRGDDGQIDDRDYLIKRFWFGDPLAR